MVLNDTIKKYVYFIVKMNKCCATEIKKQIYFKFESKNNR